jgi:5-methylcytosine-specific restriction endonuclease McrA
VKAKESLRQLLYKRDGKKCHYCGIPEEYFYEVWTTKFYGTGKRGQRLEIDRKEFSECYEPENCVLACAICNMAKSDQFTYDEFLKVGKVIRQIWRHRLSRQK